MASLYDRYILPKVTNALCSSGPNMKQREKIVPQAFGKVLEIGIGTGLNFGYYDTMKVDQLFGLDPSEEMWSIAQKQIPSSSLKVEFLKGLAEEIPLEANTLDSVLVTYTLCTIPDVDKAFTEMRRVLKPNGQLIFCEHGKAPDKSVRKWQNALNPVWRRLGGGCNLNRDIPQMIQQGGFDMQKLDTMYIPGLKVLSYNYWGVAVSK